MALHYLGTDPTNQWLPGVPARDLTDADLVDGGFDVAVLTASGLYVVDAARGRPAMLPANAPAAPVADAPAPPPEPATPPQEG